MDKGKLKIKYNYEYGPAGDQCYGYILQMSRPCTVQEFVETVLQLRPEEWGTITITTPEDYKYFDRALYRAKYYRGGAMEDNIPAEVAGKTIRTAKARGGWSLMDYFLAVEDGKTEDGKSSVSYRPPYIPVPHGKAWEWFGGVKLKNGIIQVIPDDNQDKG